MRMLDGGSGAVVLNSGGILSAAMLSLLREEGNLRKTYSLFIDYGQRNAKAESPAAAEISKLCGAERHFQVNLPGREFQKITFSPILEEAGGLHPNSKSRFNKEHPGSFLPMRSVIFGALAGSLSFSKGIQDIYFGNSLEKAELFPDMGANPMQSLGAAISASVGCDLVIKNPLYQMGYVDIILMMESFEAVDAMELLGKTQSCDCSDERGESCDNCLSCDIRKRAFKERGIEDPRCLI